MAKKPFGEAESPFSLKSGNKTTFKMMGSSPVKQDIGVHTGFGPEADANLKKMINVKTGTSKPVAKKSIKKGFWKGAKKVIGKLAWPLAALDAAINLPKLKEDQGLKKFAGSMIWDEELFTTDKPNVKITKYNPSKETKTKKVKGLYDKKSLK